MVAMSPLAEQIHFNGVFIKSLTTKDSLRLRLVPFFPNFRQVIAQRLHTDRRACSAEICPESLVPWQG